MKLSSEEKEASTMNKVDPADAMSAALNSLYITCDAAKFHACLDKQIAAAEEEMVDICKRSRGQVEGVVEEMIDAREILARWSQDLSDSEQGLRMVRGDCDEAGRRVKESNAIKENADKALEVICRTRKLVQLCGRIEVLIAERRLHAAVKLIQLFKAEKASIPLGTYLKNAIPKEEMFMQEVSMHAKRLLRSWLRAARDATMRVGEYALASGSPAISLREHSRSPWLPQIIEERHSGIWRNDLSHFDSSGSLDSSQRETGKDHTNLAVKRNSEEKHAASPPTLALQALLSSILVHKDLGKVNELQQEYQIGRRRDLEEGLNGEKRLDDLSPYEDAVIFTCGFFVIERTVALHCERAKYHLLSGAELNHFWKIAQERLNHVYSGLLHNRSQLATRGSKIRISQERLSDFARRYKFPLLLPGGHLFEKF